MTDKYKGHTERPWIIVDEGDVWDIFGETANGLGEYVTTIVMEDKGVANAHLIVDAPKLLEENKRLRDALESSLMAICFTQDYVGAELLPPIRGWDWYDAGKKIVDLIPDSPASEQFRLRCKGK